MLENNSLSSTINKVSSPQAPSIIPMHWLGLGVIYLRFKTSSVPEHRHQAIQVSIPFNTSSVEARWRTASGKLQRKSLRSGDACIIPSFQPHTIWWKQETELVAFNLEPFFIKDAAHESLTGDQLEIVEHYGAKDPMIQQLGLALQREFREGMPFGRIYLESLANALAVHLLRQYSASQQPIPEFNVGLTPFKLRRVTDFIGDHMGEDLRLAELAEVSEMSAYRFARMFKQSTGLAPHQYIICERMKEAQQLLKHTELTVAEIAYKVGCGSQSRFAVLFRRHTGTTPTYYRKNS